MGNSATVQTNLKEKLTTQHFQTMLLLDIEIEEVTEVELKTDELDLSRNSGQ